MRQEINYKKKTTKNTKTWRLNNMLGKPNGVMEEIKEEIKIYLETKENGKIQSKICKTQQKQC